MRKVALLSMLVPAVLAVVGAGAAQAKPDPSFGVEGVATLNPPYPPGWTNQKIDATATGQNGETYVVATQSNCANYRCSEGDFLFRYLARRLARTGVRGRPGLRDPAGSDESL